MREVPSADHCRAVRACREVLCFSRHAYLLQGQRKDCLSQHAEGRIGHGGADRGGPLMALADTYVLTDPRIAIAIWAAAGIVLVSLIIYAIVKILGGTATMIDRRTRAVTKHVEVRAATRPVGASTTSTAAVTRRTAPPPSSPDIDLRDSGVSAFVAEHALDLRPRLVLVPFSTEGGDPGQCQSLDLGWNTEQAGMRLPKDD